MARSRSAELQRKRTQSSESDGSHISQHRCRSSKSPRRRAGNITVRVKGHKECLSVGHPLQVLRDL